MNFKKWQNLLKEKGFEIFKLAVKQKIIEKHVQNKCFKIPLNAEQKERINHWVYYTYLRKKYLPYLKSLKVNFDNRINNDTKIIWWCWFQGEDSAPELCKKCLESLRKHMPDYTINIVTEDNINEYVEFPPAIKEKYEKGLINRTHFSDILRVFLLYEYGGAWIDSTVYVTGNITNLLTENIFFFKNYNRGDEAICCSSWLISSAKGNPIIGLMKDLMVKYWEENDNLVHYYLFHFFLTLIYEVYPNELKKIPTYSNIPPHTLQQEMFNAFDVNRFEQIKGISNVHKLTWKSNPKNLNKEGTIYRYVIERI